MIQYMEKISLKNNDNINIPDSVLIRPKIVAVFDNIKDTITLMTVVYPNRNKDNEITYKKAQELLELKVNQLKENLIQTSAITIKSNLNFKSNYSKDEYFRLYQKPKNTLKKEIFSSSYVTTI